MTERGDAPLGLLLVSANAICCQLTQYVPRNQNVFCIHGAKKDSARTVNSERTLWENVYGFLLDIYGKNHNIERTTTK